MNPKVFTNKFYNTEGVRKVEIINSKITGDVIIASDAQYNDLLSDNVTVTEGISTRIYGTVKNELTVEKNAIVYLHGKVPEKIINKGGAIYIFGPSGEVTTF